MATSPSSTGHGASTLAPSGTGQGATESQKAVRGATAAILYRVPGSDGASQSSKNLTLRRSSCSAAIIDAVEPSFSEPVAYQDLPLYTWYLPASRCLLGVSTAFFAQQPLGVSTESARRNVAEPLYPLGSGHPSSPISDSPSPLSTSLLRLLCAAPDTMAEPVGTIIGTLGLLGTVAATMKIFKSALSCDTDYVDNRVRVQGWLRQYEEIGETYRLEAAKNPSLAAIHDAIVSTHFNRLAMLIPQLQELLRKYDVETPSTLDDGLGIPGRIQIETIPAGSLEDFKAARQQIRGRAGVTGSIAWALKRKGDMKDLSEKLQLHNEGIRKETEWLENATFKQVSASNAAQETVGKNFDNHPDTDSPPKTCPPGRSAEPLALSSQSLTTQTPLAAGVFSDLAGATQVDCPSLVAARFGHTPVCDVNRLVDTIVRWILHNGDPNEEESLGIPVLHRRLLLHLQEEYPGRVAPWLLKQASEQIFDNGKTSRATVFYALQHIDGIPLQGFLPDPTVEVDILLAEAVPKVMATLPVPPNTDNARLNQSVKDNNAPVFDCDSATDIRLISALKVLCGGFMPLPMEVIEASIKRMTEDRKRASLEHATKLVTLLGICDLLGTEASTLASGNFRPMGSASSPFKTHQQPAKLDETDRGTTLAPLPSGDRNMIPDKSPESPLRLRKLCRELWDLSKRHCRRVAMPRP